MRLVVKIEFHDVYNFATVYHKGTVVEFSDERRCKDLIARGICEPEPKVEEPKEEEAIPEPEVAVPETKVEETIPETKEENTPESEVEEPKAEVEEPKKKGKK